MWEFLIKQDSGLYKPKSVADLNFIEQYYSFDESQSNADAMLGEVLPFNYDGTNVSFVDEASLPDSGTYFPFAQIDCFNNSIMVAASNTVAGAKTDLLSAINTYGVKLVRVIHISTTVPFQPLPSGGGGSVDPASTSKAGIVQLTDADGSTIYANPSQYDIVGNNPIVLNASQTKAMIQAGGGGGGVTPADLALKQDIALTSTSVYINGAIQTTVEGALEATSQAFIKMPTRASVYVVSPTDQNEHYYLLADYSNAQTSTKTFVLDGYIGNFRTGEISQFDATLFMVHDQYTDQQSIQGYYDKSLADGCDILITSDQKVYLQLNGEYKYVQLYTSIPASKIEDTSTSSSTAPDNVVSTLSQNATNVSLGGSSPLIAFDQMSLISNEPLTIDNP